MKIFPIPVAEFFSIFTVKIVFNHNQAAEDFHFCWHWKIKLYFIENQEPGTIYYFVSR